MNVQRLAKSSRTWRRHTVASAAHYQAGLGNPRRQPRSVPRDPDKAAQAFQSSVAGSVGAWAKGFKPYHDALLKLKLPRRYPLNDPRNIKRCMVVCKAMMAVKAKLQRAKAR